MVRTANPALNEKIFTAIPYYGENVMTVNGAVAKTGVLLGLCVLTAAWTWSMASAAPETAMPWVIGGLIGGLVTAMVTIFKKNLAPITGPLYAALEGLALGAISALFEMQYPGIVVSAVGLTFGVLAVMLFAYRTGLVRATDKFKMGVVAATGGIFLVYMVTLVLSFFRIQVPMIHSAGTFGILFSLFVVVIAALNLVLDFDFIENGAAAGAPKYMEWYAAFGLMVTLVWLYIEILRLLSKMRRR
ncbi:MAG: Bax inhibitor-1/YccA family protein [Phycisphaerae bacterium]|nr:Bax inhibitor-1/YccA family protein [Phycisphaerae bacterium]